MSTEEIGRTSSVILNSLTRLAKRNQASKPVSAIAKIQPKSPLVHQTLNVYVPDSVPDLPGGRLPTQEELVSFIIGLYGDTEESVREIRQAISEPGALELFMETWNGHHLHITMKPQPNSDPHKGILPMTEDKDDRISCSGCNNLTSKLSCVAAKDGKLESVTSKWYKPVPDIKRRCESFGKSKYPVSVPEDAPSVEIREVNIYNSGFHPHDKSWLKKIITASFAIPYDEAAQKKLRNDVMAQYKVQFKTAYDAFDGSQHGREGYARNIANQWLQGKIIAYKAEHGASTSMAY